MTATKASSKSNSGRKGSSSSSNSKGNYGRLSKRPQPPTSTPSSNNRNSSPHSSSSIKSNNVNKKNKTKVIPKSKHHTIIAKSSSSTKRNNYSIKKRVAAVKANKIIKATYLASGKQRKSSAISSSLANNNNNNFSKTKNGIRKASGGGGGGRSNDVVINGGRRGNLRNTRSNSKIRGNKKTTSKYHMRLPGGSCNPISNNNNNRYSFNTNTNNNSDQHVKYSDVPWFDAESQERFRDNHTSTTVSSSSSSSSGASPSLSTTINTSSVVAATTTTEATTTLSSSATATTTTATTLPQLPSETILQAMDDELHSFSIYVRLTHTERRAREKFLDHVAEQATSALLGIPSSSSSSSYRSNKNGAKHCGTVGGGKGRRGGGTGGHNAIVEEQRGVRVVPFGSFATQEVCCFASDVDMCLWGVVECESPSAMAAAMSRNNGGDVFIGDDDARDVDSDDDGDTYDDFVHANDDDADDRVMLLGRSGRSLHDDEGGDGCPLLTESSLLRTMDAIQSASAAASGNCGGVGLVAATAAKGSIDGAADAAASSVMGVKVSGTKRKQQQQQRRQSQNDDINHENEECLFFIDRVGEAAEGADSKVIDSIQRSAEGRPSNINASFASEGGSKDRNRCPDLEEHEDLHDVVAKDSDSVSSSVEGFHFDIDREGVQELGGCISGGDVEVVDLTTTDDGLLPDDAKVSTSQLKDQRAQEESVVDNRDSNVKSSCQVANGRIGGNVRREEESNLGTSALNSILEINDDSDDDTSEVIMVASVNNLDDVDEDDNDSADKMSSYYHRQNPASDVQISRTGLPASPIVLLNDDSSSSTGDLDDDYSSSDSDLEPLHTSKKEVMELSLTSDIDHNGKLLSGLGPGQRAKKPVMGPTGKARTQVVSALVCLTRQLRMCNFTHTIECRTKARVPIINCSTRTGFEGDIAIGGHNGVDTSMYAMSQVKRFRR